MSVLDRTPPPADHRLPYGPGPFHFGDLRLPAGQGRFPLLINIHGGFWRARYDLEHAGHLCAALAAAGIATWNIEYRRIGHEGGGWPGTLEDVRAAVSHAAALAGQFPLDLARVAVMGHSAGGHLACWVSGERLPFPLRAAISLAGVLDLQRAWELGLSERVVDTFLGGSHARFPARYRAASPIERLPTGVPQRLIHGVEDDIVPLEISERYLAAATRAGDAATLRALPATGHFEPIDPASGAWGVVAGVVGEVLAEQMENRE